MKVFAPLFILIFSLSAGYAQNADSSLPVKIAPWYVEKFRLTAGFFLPVNNTNIQVSVQGGAEGTDIDFEKDLGFNSTIGTFLGNAQWRISRRSRFSLSYYDIRRSSVHTLQKEITFRDKTYDVNTTVKTVFNTAIYQFSYGYAILSKPNYEAGVMVGAHMVGAKVGIDVNGVNAGISKASNFDFTAPLPDLGLWGGYTFSDRLAVTGDVDYLALTIGDIKGSIFAYNIAFTYRLYKKLDLSLGYTGLNFQVDAKKKEALGIFNWSYNGPALTVSYSFGRKSWGN